ncbi:MAG: aminotransferase class I/II-fold pyridoxal phosphate-dependent enzyme, partial [Polyangiaceae bacterium]
QRASQPAGCRGYFVAGPDMEIVASRRVRSIGGYAFAEVERQVERLREQGVEPIDFGVGDPTDPTPEAVRRACQRAVDAHARSGYPSYTGSIEFRNAVAAWFSGRFGVALDPRTEVSSTVGSKEGVFHFAEGFIDPGDVVLCPNPGYPPYFRGTLFAEGEPAPYAMRAEDDYLPDLEKVPRDVVRRAKAVWINYPNSPTGKVAPPEYLERCVRFARKNGLILCSDEAYTEIYFTAEAPRSALEFGKEGVLVFNSLSKRSMMTGYRVGYVAGDPRIVSIFRKVKTNIDSGTPNFCQEAAIAALADETHVAAMRDEYRRRRDALCSGLARAGLERCVPEGTIYVWQRLPRGVTSTDFATRLLAPEAAIVCTPGSWISHAAPDGTNPGDGYARFSLVPSFEATVVAAARLARIEFAR